MRKIITRWLFTILSITPYLSWAGFSVAPMSVQLETQQGRAGTEITVKNVGENASRITVNAGAFTYTADGFKALEEDPQDLSPYLVFAPAHLIVQPGQERRIRINIRLLPSTPPGEYRAAIYVEDAEVTDVEKSQTSIVPRIGVAVYLRHGTVAERLKPQNANYENGKITLTIANNGDATAQPKTNWRLLRNSRELAQAESPAYTIIAGGTRHITLESPAISKLAVGTYQVAGELQWNVAGEDKQLEFNQNLIVRKATK